jgi:hypothetical protein
MTNNDTYGFFALLPICSEIKLELGPSQIMIFLIMDFFPIPLRIRVDPMIYIGSSNHLKKNWGKNKMAAKIKMAAKHAFSIIQKIFMQFN